MTGEPPVDCPGLPPYFKSLSTMGDSEQVTVPDVPKPDSEGSVCEDSSVRASGGGGHGGGGGGPADIPKVSWDGKEYAPLADGKYDVIILGTGLKESILSGLLSTRGKKVRGAAI